jgi:ferredoxin-NADP reductase
MSQILNLRVTAIGRKSPTVRMFELRPIGPESLPSFGAGSHIDLHLPTGLVRSYSLINSERERHRLSSESRLTATVAVHRAFSTIACEWRDTLGVGVPRNLFALDKGADAALIGGDVGATPLLYMAARLAELDRSWTLR